MATVRWTDEALSWLEDIHAYIARDNLRAAGKDIDGIVAKVELLTHLTDAIGDTLG